MQNMCKDILDDIYSLIDPLSIHARDGDDHYDLDKRLLLDDDNSDWYDTNFDDDDF